jgi:hypothetical protein
MEKEIDTKKYPLFFLIPAAVGIFFLIFGLSIVWSNKKRAERCTEEVSGVVLQMLERDGNNGHLYTPVFEYVLAVRFLGRKVTMPPTRQSLARAKRLLLW